MTILSHLDGFTSTEGYWHKEEIFKSAIVDIIDIVKPKNMLEIGFNIGYSASMWLHHSEYLGMNLTSVDIGYHYDTIPASEAVKNKYPARFDFIIEDSKKFTTTKQYDLIFIDGGHDEVHVESDINLSVKLNIPYLIFDDWHIQDTFTQRINGVKVTCDMHKELKLLKVYDLNIPSKIALYKNENFHPA